MFSRFRLALSLALFLALLASFPVFAGGWAVITLDELPTDVSAGEPLIIGFTVLQHGKTPMTDLDPTVTASSGGEKIMFFAEEEGKPGHYTATLTFPNEGKWEWSIQAFTMDQAMPALTVASPAKLEAKTAPSLSLLSVVRALALGIGLVGLVVAFRRKSRLAVALTTLCLLIGLALVMAGTGTSAALSGGEEPAVDVKSEISGISQVELGRQLFLAKGCITCHYNSKAASNSEYWTIEMGATNLSSFTASPEALRLRLKDPSSVKSDTQMPNLNLSEAEIEALIAFINSK
jgi:mono/diheme cytochrome c family protein